MKRKRELRGNSRHEWARPSHCSIWVDGGGRDDNHIAKVDTNTNADASLIGHARVPLGHLPLHGDRAGQKTIAHELEDAAVVFLDRGLEELFAMVTQPGEGPRLVALHKGRVTNNVGCQEATSSRRWKIGPAAKAAIPVLEAPKGESVIGSYARDASKEIRGY